MKRLKGRRQGLWLSRHLVENVAKKGSQPSLQKHRVQVVSQILLRFTQRGTAWALSSSEADIKHTSEAQRWGLGSAQHWIAPGRKRRQDQNRDTEQRRESQRTRLAKTCRGDNKDSRLQGGSSLCQHYQSHMSQSSLGDSSNHNLHFPKAFTQGAGPPLCRLSSHPSQPAFLKAIPRDAMLSIVFWCLTQEFLSSHQSASCSRSNLPNTLT